jgi:cellulose synthase/poly-beta-1,6-N-acetylglucosamine synthase-like glycosyltransferase
MFILELLYISCTALLAVYGFYTLAHAWIFWRERWRSSDGAVAGEPSPGRNDEDLPSVTVQLPIYNERHVVKRLIEATAALDWPADRLQIQVLDDSTDDTSKAIAKTLSRLQHDRIQFEHVRRSDRQGYKAGALQFGMHSARGEFIAIFDADFVPPPDFLRRTLPAFQADVGCVQARWGHINRDTSALTQAQALGIDGHFIVEQRARAAAGAFLNFNGTAGVWRRSCMEEVGGWQGDTLTEDLDLSYRAQLAGWRIAYLSDVVVPAEVPVHVEAFKRQQFRWAKGSLQTAIKLLGSLWRSPNPLWRKLAGSLHLTNYTVHPLMTLNLLLLLPMTLSDTGLLKVAALFTTAAIGPPIMYWTALQAEQDEHRSWLLRLGQLARLVAIGTGLSVNNSIAAMEAVTGRKSEFKRTPKFAVTGRADGWQASSYVLPRDPTAWIELVLALYATGLLIYCVLAGIWWLIPWLLLYVSGYSFMAYQAFAQAWQVRRVRSGLVTSALPHPSEPTQ